MLPTKRDVHSANGGAASAMHAPSMRPIHSNVFECRVSQSPLTDNGLESPSSFHQARAKYALRLCALVVIQRKPLFADK